MPATNPLIKRRNLQWLYTLVAALLLASCATIPRKYQKDKPFLYNYEININTNSLTASQKANLKQRLAAQLDDSSRRQTKDVLVVLHYLDKPPVYDSNSTAQSAKYMTYSMQYLGYFDARVETRYKMVRKGDQQRVIVTYDVYPGKETRIESNRYRFEKKPELDSLVKATQQASLLQVKEPFTKAVVYSELNRLITLFKNNGYYRFTGDEVRVRGDTTTTALTNIDNPFEALEQLTRIRQKRDSPTIKLSVDLLTPKDTNRLAKYYVRNIYILPDFGSGDSLNMPNAIVVDTGGCVIRYNERIFKEGFLLRNVFFKRGEAYNQEKYYQTINSFSKVGAWQSINIQVVELPGSHLLDMIIELIPNKKFGFEASVESSYSVNSNTTTLANANVGNVLGLSSSVGLTNRNMGKEAIRMTTTLRGGVELNVGNAQKNGLINSNEVSLSNGITIPRLLTVWPFTFIKKGRPCISEQTLINTNLSYINRINLFNLQSVNFSFAYEWTKRANRKWTLRPLNIEFTKLYNESDTFIKTLEENPFLRYSFTTALVMSMSLNYNSVYYNPKFAGRQRTFKWNVEESGLLGGFLKNISAGSNNIFSRYLRRFIKMDADYNYTKTYRNKSELVLRGFLGVGIPIGKADTTLPFFKQYFGGGSNSMRGWPIRGVGRGGQRLAPYSGGNNTTLNDRTGDIQLEGNVEYRYNIANIIPGTMMLKGALFADVGNVWNFKNTNPDRSPDITQFKMRNLYQQLAVSAGTGFRFDFSFFLVRFDFGFRFKRPDVDEDNGWQIPSVNLKNIFSPSRRQWRYENYNFTIGINYPF